MDTGLFGLAKYTALKKDTPNKYTIEEVIDMIKKGEVKIDGYELKPIVKATKKKGKGKDNIVITTEGEDIVAMEDK